jgi:hypothetical protein
VFACVSTVTYQIFVRAKKIQTEVVEEFFQTVALGGPQAVFEEKLIAEI